MGPDFVEESCEARRLNFFFIAGGFAGVWRYLRLADFLNRYPVNSFGGLVE